MAFFKDFLTKQLLKKQLKGVPEDQQEKIMTLIQKDPEFFKVIGEKIVHSIKLFEPRIVCRNCDVKALMDLNTYDITIVAEIPIINTTFSINSSLDLKKQMFIFAETSRNI